MDHSVTVSLDGQEYEIHRARLGQYLRIQEASAGLLRASSEGDHRSIVDAIFAFFQVSIPDLTMEQFLENDWMQIAIAYAEIQNLNAPAFDLAIFKYSDEGGLPVPWEYPERIRFFWIHSLAKVYHWTREAIEHLWPEEASAFLQEIVADEQYEHEFIYSLSEVAYHYDQATKKSKFKPLQRPAWMVLRDPKSLITRMPVALMPVGEVVYPEDDEVVH